MTEVLLEVRGVSKSFPGNRALDHVSISIHRREIVALLGHNGSGKSTLVKVLSGIYEKDEGEILLGGAQRPTQLHFIHQNLGLVPTLTVIENLDLGVPMHAGGVLPFRRRSERRRVEKLIAQFGVAIDVMVPVGTLSPAEQTIVAIVRAFDGWTGDDNVLVLDEPTAALHGDEVDVLQNAIRMVADRGAGVVYISHRLGEVVELADRVVVLRDGVVVAERRRGDFDQSTLVSIIAGGKMQAAVDKRAAERGSVRLSVRGLVAPSLAGVDFDVHAGEILGISGLVGSGMENLNGTVFGSVPALGGSVSVDADDLRLGVPSTSITRGLAFVPADRRGRASIGLLSARENMTLPRLSTLRMPGGSVSLKRERAEVDDWMRRVHVHPAGSREQRFERFSGGNQQKIVLAKWLRLAPRVLLLDEPTQGVDVGAQAEIYELLMAAAESGAAIIVSSSDTKELAALCDRVLVMRDGRVVEQFDRDRLNESSLVRAVVDDRAGSDTTGIGIS